MKISPSTIGLCQRSLCIAVLRVEHAITSFQEERQQLNALEQGGYSVMYLSVRIACHSHDV